MKDESERSAKAKEYWKEQRERYKNVIGMAESVGAGHCTHTGHLRFSYDQLEELCMVLAAKTAAVVRRRET